VKYIIFSRLLNDLPTLFRAKNTALRVNYDCRTKRTLYFNKFEFKVHRQFIEKNDLIILECLKDFNPTKYFLSPH